MLVLHRNFGRWVRVTVCGVTFRVGVDRPGRGHDVKLCFDAPLEVKVVREELIPKPEAP